MADPNDWSDLSGKADDWSDLAAPVAKRTAAQRFAENDRNATLINPGVAVMREGFVTGTGAKAQNMADYFRAQASHALSGPLAPARSASAILGDLTETFHPGAQQMVRQGERDRRAEFQARSEADPWYDAPGGFMGKAQAGAATLLGNLTGGMKDPTNWISPGRTAWGRIAGAAGMNAGGDVLTQGADLQAGVQDRFDPVQTAVAGAVGAGIGTTAEVGRAGLGALPLPGRDRGGPARTPDAPSQPPGGDWSDLAAPQTRSQPDVAPAAAPARPDAGNPLVASIRSIAAQEGIDPDFAVRVAEIESSLNPQAQNPNSSAGGLYQFIDDTWEGLGGGDKTDPDLSARRFAELTRRNAGQLEEALGRPPEAWEMYLAHQQGAEGARRLLTNPEARAVDVVGADAVRLNGGRLDMTAGEFAATWRTKYGAAGAGPVARGQYAAARPAETFGEFGPLDPPRSERAAPAGEAPDYTLGSVFDEPSRLADRQAADGSGAPGAGLGPDPRSGEASAPRFIDQQHARFYDLGREALDGRVNRELAADLSRTMARDMDWSDLGLSPRERRIFRSEGTINSRRMVEAAKAFVEDVDAPHNRNRLVSYYDPDRYAEVMGRNAVPQRAAGLDVASLPQRGEAAPAIPQRGAAGRIDALPQLDSTRRGMLDPRAMAQRAAAEPPGSARRAAIDLSRYGGDALNASRPSAGSGGLRGAPVHSGARMGEGSPDYRGQRLGAIAKRLRQAMGVTQRQGRMTLKRAAGEFDPRTGIVRTRSSLQGVQKLAHEAFHHLEHIGRPARVIEAARRFAGELRPLAYEGANPAHIREEGFAEFGRLYITNPDHARQAAPGFFDAFEEALAQDNPALARELKTLQGEYRAMLHGAALEVSADAMAYTGNKGPVGELADAYEQHGVAGVILQAEDEAYRGAFDKNHPINVWMREVQKLSQQNTGQRLDFKAAENPYVLARMADHAYAQGHSDLINGLAAYHSATPEGPTFPQIYKAAFPGRKPTEEMDRQFQAYLKARRMVNLWDRHAAGKLENPPDAEEFDRAFHQRVIEDGDRLHPTWREASDMVHDFARRQLALERDAGLISAEFHDAALENNPFYVPFQRDMSDAGLPPGAAKPKRSGQYLGLDQAITGSDRAIILPMISLARRAFIVRAAIARNEVIGAMRKAAARVGDNNGALLEVLPAKQLEAIEVDVARTLKTLADAMGVEEVDRAAMRVFQTSELEGLMTATLFRQTDIVPRKGEAIVFHWENGEKTPLLLPDGEFGQKLFTALTGMTKDTRTLWEEVFAASAQALRLGVTGMPEFALKTSIRDQFAAAMLTDVGYVPGLDFVRGAAHLARNSDTARRYQALAGLKGGVNVAALRQPFPRNDLQAKQQLRRVTGRPGLRDRWSALMHLADWGDTATRLGVFAKAEFAARKRGLSDYEAGIEARHTAADFFDPSRHGAWPGIIQTARIFPFFNSALQGNDVAFRRLRHIANRGGTETDARQRKQAVQTLAMLSATAVLGGTLVALWGDSPEWQNINDQKRATNWPLFPTGDGEWFMWPKTFELGMPSNLVERVIEHVKGDPRTWEKIRSDIMHTMAPTRETPGLAVPFQVARNRDHSGRPIRPDHLRGTVEPKFEFNAWTSAVAKKVGAVANVSPAVIEHWITGMFGTAGRDALRVADAGINAAQGKPGMAGRAPDHYVVRGYVQRTSRGALSEGKFWELMARDGKFTRNAGTLRLMIREGQTAEAQAYLRKLDPAARSYVASEVLLGGDFKTFHPLARAQRAAGVISDVRKENREGTLSLGAEVIALSPKERRLVDDALDDLALAQLHNAQVRAGVKGWAQRPMLPKEEPADVLRKISPEIERAVTIRLLEEKVFPAGISDQVWRRLRVAPESLTDQHVAALVTAKRVGTDEGKMRTIRQEIGRRAVPQRADDGDWSSLAVSR